MRLPGHKEAVLPKKVRVHVDSSSSETQQRHCWKIWGYESTYLPERDIKATTQQCVFIIGRQSSCFNKKKGPQCAVVHATSP